MAADPSALGELRALKLQVVPVTVVDGQPIIGFNRPALIKAVGLGRSARQEDEGQAIAWMLRKFETVLTAAMRATSQIPDSLIDWTSPERGRNLRQFTFHIYDRPNMMLEAYRKGGYTAEDRGRYVNDALERPDVASIVHFGEDVLRRIQTFLGTATQEALESVVDTYMGPMTLHQLLDLGLGHSVHHLKQLYVFMGQIGIVPHRPLSKSDFDGVAVPTELF